MYGLSSWPTPVPSSPPFLEGLFGTILESWPTIEPMLMDFVSMLSEGLGEAIPVVMELGQTLLPVLTDVLGTLFQAATPLISVSPTWPKLSCRPWQTSSV